MARKWYFTASLLFSQETYPNVFFTKRVVFPVKITESFFMYLNVKIKNGIII